MAENMNVNAINKMSRGRARVEAMRFPELNWELPRVGREVSRFVLSNGLTVFALADRSLPIFSLDFRARGGTLHERKHRKREAALSLSLLRSGGTARYAPEEFDELLDFHGLSLSGQARLETSALTCWGLSSKMDTALELLAELLTQPRLDEAKLAILKGQWAEALRRRNDNPNDVALREFSYLLYGDDPQGWDDCLEELNAFTGDELRAWHCREWDPAHCYLAVSGDFDLEALAEQLERALAVWSPGANVVPTIPALTSAPAQGSYLIDRAVNQSSLCLGMRGVERFDPQLPAIEVANYIFGGGSFSARLMDKVRTREGLAYSIYSVVDTSTLRLGRVLINAQTRTEATQRVLDSVRAEMDLIRTELVSEAELSQAQESLINGILMAFADSDDAVAALMQLEIIGRPRDFFQTFVTGLRQVTREEVREAARRVYRPEEMLTVVVGNAEHLRERCPQSAEWTKHAIK